MQSKQQERVGVSEEEQLMQNKISWLYRVINTETKLFDTLKDVVPIFIGSEQMIATPVQQFNEQQWDNVSTGYGELTSGSMDKILRYLCYEAPPDLRLNEESKFLDIGSGFGKVVFHTRLRSRCKQAAGIEYVQSRHSKAQQCLAYLEARFVPSLADCNVPAEYTDLGLSSDNCTLVQADATSEQCLPLILNATHIYSFDLVFSEAAHDVLLPLIAQTGFKMLVTYREDRLQKLGLDVHLQLIHSIPGLSTTGKQNFTAFFYIRKNLEYDTTERSLRGGSCGPLTYNRALCILKKSLKVVEAERKQLQLMKKNGIKKAVAGTRVAKRKSSIRARPNDEQATPKRGRPLKIISVKANGKISQQSLIIRGEVQSVRPASPKSKFNSPIPTYPTSKSKNQKAPLTAVSQPPPSNQQPLGDGDFLKYCNDCRAQSISAMSYRQWLKQHGSGKSQNSAETWETLVPWYQFVPLPDVKRKSRSPADLHFQ